MNLTVGFSNARRKARVIAKAVACGALLLVLPACRIPGLRGPDAGPDLPAGYTAPAVPPGFAGPANPDNAVALAVAAGGFGIVAPPPPGSIAVAPFFQDGSPLPGVDEFYDDPALARLIAQAMAGNRELRMLDEEVQIAGNEILARRGAYLPFVTIGGGGGVDRASLYTRGGAVDSQLTFPSGPIPNPMTSSSLGLNAVWQLDIWRKFRNAKDAAVERYVAANEKRNYFATRLVADIAENYYRLMALDKRLENLNDTIKIQDQSRRVAVAKRDAGRDTDLPVQRFQAEVRKNESEKYITAQEIVETENRINFLVNRFPQPVERVSSGFLDLNIRTLSAGVPAQLLQNRPDIRQAERELAAAGLDVKIARAEFFPSLSISAGVGYEAFNPKYLFSPDAFVANAAGNLVAPLVNKTAIQAAFGSANARQLQCVYNYQRVVLNAFTEVVNRLSMAENYRKSVEIKKQQLESLEASVNAANQLFMNPREGARVEYLDVLFALRDQLEAKTGLIEAKKQQLAAVVNAYQALGGGDPSRVPSRPR